MEHQVYDNMQGGGVNLHQGNEHHHEHNMMNYDQPSMSSNYTSSLMGSEHDMSMMSMSMMMMKMYFHFGLGDMVLFKSLVLDSMFKMWATCLMLFLCSILLEAIDYSRGYLSCHCNRQQREKRILRANAQSRQASAAHLISESENNNNNNNSSSNGIDQSTAAHHREWSCCSGSNNNSDNNNNSGSPTGKFFPVQTSDPPLIRLVQSLLQVIRTTLSLGLMLVVMTYNLCLIFPIVLGKF